MSNDEDRHAENKSITALMKALPQMSLTLEQQTRAILEMLRRTRKTAPCLLHSHCVYVEDTMILNHGHSKTSGLLI